MGAVHGQAWVSDEAGRAETVFDARTGQAVATVPLGGEAGNVRFDPSTDHVLVDVQTRNQIAVIDPRIHRPIGTAVGQSTQAGLSFCNARQTLPRP